MSSLSRLRASEHVHLDRYQADQLLDILAARARWGLDPDVITTRQLERIADAAAGDARLAIGILRTAASKAERTGADTITDERLLDAAADARAELKQKNLDSLTPHQRIVYNIVRDHGPLPPNDIHDRYQTQVDDPRGIP